jgi:hypothetical protein
MIPQPAENREKLIQSFIDSGLPEETAKEMADELIQGSSLIKPGITFGGVDEAEIITLWRRAVQSGAKALTLEIRCDPPNQNDWYHLAVKVVSLERWDGQGVGS